MTTFTNDEAQLSKLAGSIAATPPRPHHSGLITIANNIRSGISFEYALNRGGWYRPGGVVAADGRRIAESLESWAKSELEDCSDDMGELVERYATKDLLVTRHSGQTHYFVAAYGPAPDDFMQLEVEELQEVLDRKLIDQDNPAEELIELIDPFSPIILDALALKAPQYQFRRLIDMRQIVARLSIANGRTNVLARMLDEWSHSSAAKRGHFSDHWVVALREHLDRYRNPVITASLISRHSRVLKPFYWNTELSGVEMGAQVQAFNRAAGYSSAWYFHLIAGTITPPMIAYAVMRDLEAGFSYLPDTEVALIKSWIERPYSV
jgi:hypothetical protein